MASSHAIVILSLIVLASSHSLVQARMVPSDHHPVQVHASEMTIATSSLPLSKDTLQVFMAPPPGMPLAVTDKMEIAERRRIIQVQGSVPSPGVGHH